MSKQDTAGSYSAGKGRLAARSIATALHELNIKYTDICLDAAKTNQAISLFRPEASDDDLCSLTSKSEKNYPK